MALTFYNGSGSPFAWKVWLTLEHKQIPYELKTLSFDKRENQTPEYLAISPRGKLPAVVDGWAKLCESDAIAHYLEERYPDRPLMPTSPFERAMVRRLCSEVDSYLYPAVHEVLGLTLHGRTGEPGDLARAQEHLSSELERFEGYAKADQFFVGGAVSLADFAIYPALRLAKRVEDRQPHNATALRSFPRLGAFMGRVEALPYYGKTTPPHWKS